MNMINIGFSGSQAAQAQLNATAMNTANAFTPGYSRQRVELSAIGPMGNAGMTPGNGVETTAIRRVNDQFVTGQVWRATSSSGYYGMSQQYLSGLETLLGTSSTSLGNGLDTFFAALSEGTTQPDSSALRQQMITEANSLATRFNNTNDFMNKQRSDLHNQQKTTLDSINTLSGNIADYNQKIMELESTGGSTSVLRDQRDELVRELSGLADVRVTESGDGSYSVTLSSGQPLVSGRSSGSLAMSVDDEGNPQLALSFAGTTFPASMSCGGQLGALYDYETGTLAEMQASVNGMAQALANAFNDQLAAGFDLDGNPGKPLFSFDPSNPAGILQVNDLDWRELALSGADDEPGNGDNLKALIDIKNQKVTIPGMGEMSLSEGAASIISKIGITSRQNQTEMTAANTLLNQTQNQWASISGVSQEEEAMNLMQYTQAYNANLKVISTGNQIFTDLLALF
ncbi:flagellar hook-associated protein FlgK [Rahnella sp. PD12R]|uniref:flagellar hook-associated protein FlgK n=1 Tax=Rahnella sp. PD12R TaxID=2855688 RepID=UPI001C4665DF|nr:flagellar hook-associated protein FlgK [Rahnella sp. PD12R]MBV6820085.1 flagellar hook-associated protein FlgK [Rahnella sp. PD12R]